MMYHCNKKLKEFEEYHEALLKQIKTLALKIKKIETFKALGLREHELVNGQMQFVKYGFERGLVPDKILKAVRNKNGDNKFLVKWKDCDEMDIVSMADARENCPQLLIDFYERHYSVESDSTDIKIRFF